MAIGAFEVLQSAILEVASSLDESGGALPDGSGRSAGAAEPRSASSAVAIGLAMGAAA